MIGAWVSWVSGGSRFQGFRVFKGYKGFKIFKGFRGFMGFGRQTQRVSICRREKPVSIGAGVCDTEQKTHYL